MYRIIGGDQKEYGPVSAEEMHRWITQRRLHAGSLVQAQGNPDWKPLSLFPEFSAALTALAPAPFSTPAGSVLTPRLVPSTATRAPSTGRRLVRFTSEPATIALCARAVCAKTIVRAATASNRTIASHVSDRDTISVADCNIRVGDFSAHSIAFFPDGAVPSPLALSHPASCGIRRPAAL